MHILSGKSKCIDRSTSREREGERERERCVFFLNFVIFLTLRTRLRISKFRVAYILAKNSDRRDYIINGISADGVQAKAFWFSEGFLK